MSPNSTETRHTLQQLEGTLGPLTQSEYFWFLEGYLNTYFDEAASV